MQKGRALAIVLDDGEKHESTALTQKRGAPKALALIVLESTTWPGTKSRSSGRFWNNAGSRAERISIWHSRPSGKTLAIPTSRPSRFQKSSAPTTRWRSDCQRPCMAQSLSVRSLLRPPAWPSVKLNESIFRAVNIAIVNELKMVYEEMGIDVWEVIEAAKSEPFGNMSYYPGPGLGGHCIPIDSFYLTWKPREFNISTRFIELAFEINHRCRAWTRPPKALNTYFGRGLRARILSSASPTKEERGDIRESPAVKTMELIEGRGATTEFYDPMWKKLRARADTRSWPADQDGVDYRALANNAKLVVDTRNGCARTGTAAIHNIIKA